MKGRMNRILARLNYIWAALIVITAVPAMYFSWTSESWTTFLWQSFALGFALDYLIVTKLPRAKRRAAAGGGGGE